jgi:voltage-gated potassium channel
MDAPGKIFSILLILGGIGTAAWVFTTIIEVFVSEQGLRIIGRRRMERRVKALTGHYIVCGFGRIGQQIAQMYNQERVPYVIIEREESRLAMLRAEDIAHVEGDAADDDALRQAGIDRARALIAVTPTDAINTFIVLTARGLCPNLFIVARADSVQNEAKLYRAGASKVVSPHILGGRWMGMTAVNPAVTEFITAMTEIDHANFVLHEFQLDDETPFVGQRFGEAELKRRSGALVVAIRQGADDHRFVPNPGDHLRLSSGDILIAMGTLEELNRLANLVRPDRPEPVQPYGLDRLLS